MKFGDIPELTREGSYNVNTALEDIEYTIARYQEVNEAHAPLDLMPDFQRGHVWTEAQQVAFVEFFLKGGCSGRVLYFNCPNWAHFRKIKDGGYKDFVIVDGLQRLTALRRFVRGEIPAFGHYHLHEGVTPSPGREYFEDNARRSRANYNLVININNLKTKAQVLQWYLEMNSGGTPHTNKELDKVREMLSKE